MKSLTRLNIRTNLRRQIIKEIAAAAGQNVSEYINQAIKERMERDQRMTTEEQE